MQLRSFKAQGFKNFRQPVALDDLGPINVIHGPNNVGKSNLLHAIELLFFVIGIQYESGIPVQTSIAISDEAFLQGGFIRADLFNIEAPVPIQLEADVITTEEELTRAGLWPPTVPVEQIHIEAELRWTGTHVQYTLLHFKTADQRDFSVGMRDHPENSFLSAFATFLSKNFGIASEAAFRFIRIGVERSMSPSLALALYDAKESIDIEAARRWERFVEVMAGFKDILGQGRFVVTYDRKTRQANLLYQTPRARIPVQFLGSGVQQIAALLAGVLVSRATIVGIEEPELNLRYTLQLRLREVLRAIVGGPGGLDQLFITSHSDAFEEGSHFYYMEPTPDGPRVEKRHVKEARVALGITSEGTLPDPRSVLCYLSTEGVVRVPERIRNALGLPDGGGVIFLERNGTVEMISDDAFADRFEPKPEGEGDDHS